MDLSTAKLIEHEEGYREKPYYCSECYPTIGIGKKLGPKGASLDLYQFMVSRQTALQWLNDDIEIINMMLRAKFDWFERLNQARKDIIISMCYQLGFDGFSKFKNTINLIADGRFVEASQEMLDSKWAKQTPERAYRHSKVMAVGDYGVVKLYDDID